MISNAPFSSTRAFALLAWVGLLIWILLLFLQQTNLAASDLGRHIMNGKVTLESHRVFQTNYYSYTNSQYAAQNHHWGFGVLAFSLLQMGGFPLITLTIALVYWTGIVGMLLLSKRLTTSWNTYATTCLLLPLIAMRTESRPEAFSVLGVSFTILICHWAWNRPLILSRMKAVALVLVTMSIWVNVHILFILGLFIVGCYLLFAFFSKSKERVVTFFCVLLAQLIAVTINPAGWKALFYPLQIMQNYQYPVAENQSVFFFLRYHPSTQYYYLFFILFMTACSLIFSYKKIAHQFRPIWLITTILLIATLCMNRISAFFQLPALIVLAVTAEQLKLHQLVKNFFSSNWLNQPLKVISSTIIFACVIVTVVATNLFNPIKPTFGLGILPNVEVAGDFFTANHLPGPIFNNYDNGGYVIYKLFPTQKVFVDNRPEAYPGTFLTDRYIAAQQDEKIWQALENEYHFNTIFFYRFDATDWAQPFLIRRIDDPSWIPIYVDSYSLILIKNTSENQPIITKLQLPKSLFMIQKN